MQLHDLAPTPGSRKAPKRLGRGTGSGHGKTSTKGHKGQNARAGGGVRPGFEGGQMPLTRRMPKRGFSNEPFRTRYEVLNLTDLERFEEGTVVTPELLEETRLCKNALKGVKLLGTGDVTKAFTIRIHQISETAKQKIEAAGGKVELLATDTEEVK